MIGLKRAFALACVGVMAIGGAAVEARQVLEPPPNVYDPNTDIRIHYGLAGMRDASMRLFGWFDPSASLFLDPERYIDIQDGTPGTSGRLPDLIQIENTLREDAQIEIVGSNEIDAQRVGTVDDFRLFRWFGCVTSPGASVICSGLFLTSESRNRQHFTIQLTFTDEADGQSLFDTMLEVSQRAAPRCILDARAMADRESFILSARACDETRRDTILVHEAICAALMLLTCAIPPSPLCIAGIICEGLCIANGILFYRNFRSEQARFEACLCLQARARDTGNPVPPCPPFECPPIPINPSFK
ncbi:MAG: hypothetical protein H7210_07885 [Pyrinomonadaceae bacterium]|nr:hypothetical protein [Phycisphaerales bacterium]